VKKKSEVSSTDSDEQRVFVNTKFTGRPVLCSRHSVHYKGNSRIIMIRAETSLLMEESDFA